MGEIKFVLLLHLLTLACLFWLQPTEKKKKKVTQGVACFLVGFKQLWFSAGSRFIPTTNSSCAPPSLVTIPFICPQLFYDFVNFLV